MRKGTCFRLSVAPLLACSIVVGGLASCAEESTGPGSSGRAVTLSVRTLDARALGGLVATWTHFNTGTQVSVAVPPSGVFTLDLPILDGEGELALDGPGPRRYHPFLYPFSVQELEDLQGQELVLIPRQWQIERGIYRGQIVEIHLDPVVEDEADQTLYTYLFGQPHPRDAPDTYRLDLLTWPLANTPARVAFDHRQGVAPLPVQDSAAIWSALNRIEEVFGIDLFRPEIGADDWWPDPPFPDPGYRTGVIRLIYDGATWRGLPLGKDTLPTWEGDLGRSAGQGRFSRYQINRQFLDAGLLRVGSLEPLQLADGLVPWETVLAHEVLHVLGVGHTFRIASTQGPRLRTSDPSQMDVAYMEMVRALMELEREGLTFQALIPAIAGERRLILGLPALPTLQ